MSDETIRIAHPNRPVVQFWGRSHPETVFGQPYDARRQAALLEQALIRHGDILALSGLDGASKRPNAVAVGDGARRVLEHCRRHVSKQSHQERPDALYGTLLLIVPELPDDAFVCTERPLSINALALQAVGRVIVLACGRDTTLPASDASLTGKRLLGRDGSARGSSARVTTLEIGDLIEYHQDAAYGVLCSQEALGLATQLLSGIATAHSLSRWARSAVPVSG